MVEDGTVQASKVEVDLKLRVRLPVLPAVLEKNRARPPL
jgi:hypothetical protein